MRIDVEFHMSPAARRAMSILTSNGFNANYVGGCVRDILLNVKPKDFDISTNARPEQVVEVFNRYGVNVHNNGKGMAHGTSIAEVDGESIEITTYRKEGTYSDGRRPDYVEFFNSLEEDLARRDFTINAMAIDQHGNLIDLFGGQKDLEDNVIRCVGNTCDRFNEDALRVLRAIRFACRFNFLLDREITNFMCYNPTILADKGISVERIREEMCKIIVSDRAMFGMYMLLDYELMSHIAVIPYSRGLKLLSNTPNDLITRLACLFVDVEQERVQQILVRLKLNTETFNNVAKLVYHVNSRKFCGTRKEVKILINSLSLQLVDIYFKIKSELAFIEKDDNELSNILIDSNIVYDIITAGEPLVLKDLAVNGHDIIGAGIEPGREVSKTLDYLMDVVLDDATLNTRESLMNLVYERIVCRGH